MTILTFRYTHCLHLMYTKVAIALISSGTQVQPQIILYSNCLQTILAFLMTMIKRNFAVISSLIYNIIASPYWFQLSQKWALKPSISNLFVEKLVSILVPDVIKISAFVLIWSESKCNLFLIELILKLGDSRNFMPSILVPSSAKRIATQIIYSKLET